MLTYLEMYVYIYIYIHTYIYTHIFCCFSLSCSLSRSLHLSRLHLKSQHLGHDAGAREVDLSDTHNLAQILQGLPGGPLISDTPSGVCYSRMGNFEYLGGRVAGVVNIRERGMSCFGAGFRCQLMVYFNGLSVFEDNYGFRDGVS